jgi:hypothetical protein
MIYRLERVVKRAINDISFRESCEKQATSKTQKKGIVEFI